jgi:hypothetical protein
VTAFLANATLGACLAAAIAGRRIRSAYQRAADTARHRPAARHRADRPQPDQPPAAAA